MLLAQHPYQLLIMDHLNASSQRSIVHQQRNLVDYLLLRIRERGLATLQYFKARISDLCDESLGLVISRGLTQR